MEQRPLPADSTPALDRALERPRGWDRPALRIPLFALLALFGGRFESFSVSANLLVLGVGAALVWLGLTGRTIRRASPRRLGPQAAWWLVPVLLLSLVELYAFTRNSAADYPTLSLLADPILEDYAARSVCYFGWLMAFWVLVRR